MEIVPREEGAPRGANAFLGVPGSPSSSVSVPQAPERSRSEQNKFAIHVWGRTKRGNQNVLVGILRRYLRVYSAEVSSLKTIKENS